ncbi:maleylpyruvate isomerase family mycothiol-dependent enzyme [Amycolatopsis sp. NPDC059021]|uniref:maleylpyruvate isomerase family mycothiol-dependent enzyme n=1 Tax=Amycolatopsis sp. NPDC059021 TaxID=3346704 RepID=UPI00366B4441
MTISEQDAVVAEDYVGYAEVRRNIRRLLEEYPGAAAHPVPACPEWTVRDLLAHLVEIAERVLARFGAAVPPARGKLRLGELLDRWDTLGAGIEPLLESAGGQRGDVLVTDAFTHELDLRYALGLDFPVEHVAWVASFEVLVRGFSGSIVERGLPALRIRTPGGGAWLAGAGPAGATLTARPDVLYRSLAGRRSLDQISALTWSADPGPWLPAFAWGPFRPPMAPVEMSHRRPAA